MQNGEEERLMARVHYAVYIAVVELNQMIFKNFRDGLTVSPVTL